ncbi:conserved membrane protein of unknown function [Candidatus Hydrogenisulfobacillus filiaventi]|uniref:DUF2231 domain-containing protein n=1 Tax=Candidatus Hydrogenisulfobacillus filiaventi TaxID=2707344 RepID=A0A6F8ZDC8_9FIRM|nr:hypothetical protein [Bacillota bacterium]CAB1127878.1 conserved membrane protein of unknown function [Candidatus Hydrogenisulfobacillus filiaventi]
MGVLRALWVGLLGAWVRVGTRLFPPTIHPMVVHFPIALLWVTLLIDLLAWVGGSRDRFLDRAGFWMLSLSLLAIVGAGAAGVLSEQYVRWTPATRAILSAHQRDAALTGVFALGAWLVRWAARYPAPARGERAGWSLAGSGRGRRTWLSTLLVLGATIMVSITGTLGGSMVYGHGVGIPTRVLAHAPGTRTPRS